MYIAEVVTNTIISVAGILGTVVTASVGLYFTARSRTLPHRQVLYTKQIELTLRIFQASGTAINLIVLLLPKSKHQDQARDDLREIIAELTQLSYEAAILFPVELYVAFKRVTETMTSIVIECDKGQNITASFDTLKVEDTRWALMARQFIGVDKLSIENLQLHSRESELTRLAGVETGDALRSAVEESKDGSSESV
jgi:hypothetical protein